MEPKAAYLIDLIGASVFMLAALGAVIFGASHAPGASPATAALLLFAMAFAFSALSTVLGGPGSSGGGVMAFAFMVAALLAGVAFAVAAVAVSL